MTKKEHVQYWVKSAEDDWGVAGHLFEKGDYPYSFKKKCTKDFAERYLNEIKEIRKWLLQMIPS